MHPLIAVTAVCVHYLTGDVQMVTPKRLSHGRSANVNVAQDRTCLAAERRGRLSMSASEQGVRRVTEPHGAVRR